MWHIASYQPVQGRGLTVWKSVAAVVGPLARATVRESLYIFINIIAIAIYTVVMKFYDSP